MHEYDEIPHVPEMPSRFTQKDEDAPWLTFPFFGAALLDR